MAAKKTAKRPSKSDFIRQQPATMSAADVVAKGKAEGVKLEPSLVYKVRGSTSKRAKAKKSPAAKSSAGKRASSKGSLSKADFVRSHASLSPKEIVERAKAEGIKMDASYIYNVRGYDKTAAKKKSPKAGRRATTARNGGSVPRPVASGSSVESLLKAVAAEIGLGRAVEILQGERARVMAAIAG